jgi:subtilisin family serine protease
VPPETRTVPSPRRVLAALILTLALLASLALPGASAPREATPSDPSDVEVVHDGLVPGRDTVTLLTGDRVRVDPAGEGRASVTVEPAPRADGRVPTFRILSHGEQTFVVPSDVIGLFGQMLDPALFDVDGLLAQGLDDASADEIPLIVQRSGDAPQLLRDTPLPAASEARPLASISATATSVAKDDLGALADPLASSAAEARGGDGPATTTSTSLHDVERIWLDVWVEVELHESTGQVRAPEVWDVGFDGTGVTVAVLDTGIDDSHPDLQGKVVAAQDFTGEGDPNDLHSHGTHVASTIAGTGAASDGIQRGVAPGADLMNGKVLHAGGSGLTSWIVAGMEWAAEEGADIVNLSLGAPPGLWGSEPLTEAVEQLSASHGTLFVAAAGNGACEACIGRPADAPSALTVGAVDRDDELAWFTSRGPVPESYGLKPDVTAPGVGIVAAAADVLGVGDYVAQDGTSMAAPHAAGAAALLLHAMPELEREELKARLVATASPNADHGPYDQGGGRIDIAAALNAPATVDRAAVDLGYLRWPHDDGETRVETITYVNHGGDDLTLELELDLRDEAGAPVPAAAVTVQPSSLTLAPGASASADVTLDTGAEPYGTVGGYLTASANDEVLHTPVGYHLEGPHHELTMEAIARDGRPAPVKTPDIVDVSDGRSISLGLEPCTDEPWWVNPCVRVPEGTYALYAFVETLAAWHDGPTDVFHPPLHHTLVGDPELVLDQDMTFVFDARDAVEVTVETPAHDATPVLGGAQLLGWHRWGEGHSGGAGHLFFSAPGAQLEERFFATPSAAVDQGDLAVFTRWRLQEPAISMSVQGANDLPIDVRQFRADWFSDVTPQLPQLDGTVTLPVVHVGEAGPDDLDGVDLDGVLALIRRADGVPVAEQANAVAEAGAELAVVYHHQPGLNADPGHPGMRIAVPLYHLSGEQGAALAAQSEDGEVAVTATGQPASPYSYDLVLTERGEVPDEMHHVIGPDDVVAVERHFHSVGTDDGLVMSESSAPFQSWETQSWATLYPFQQVLRTRIDYHLADPTVGWRYSVQVPQVPYNVNFPDDDDAPPPEWERAQLWFGTQMTSYGEAHAEEQSFLARPIVPAPDPALPIGRAGDNLVIFGAGVTDADGNFSEVHTRGGIETLFQVWQGDDLLAETEYVPTMPATLPPIILPPEEETYRITYDVQNAAPWADPVTSSRSEWTFRSSTVGADQLYALPLLTVTYDVPTDLHNRMLDPRDRRGPNTITIEVGHQADVDIALADVEVAISYDDGATWRDANRVRGIGDGRYEATLPARGPAGAEHLSIRVEVEDVDGNRLEQEAIRALILP